MARTVDERVVEMRFDNKNFERNIDSSIKSLEALKKSLNMDDAANSFNDFEKSITNVSKDVDFSHIEKQLNGLESRFSIVGERFHHFINEMIDGAKSFANQFTIAPVKMGLSEYEEKMDAIKLAMANTGEDLESVKTVLEELNIYADKTIYKFSDMTSNLGKFTAQGVGLQDSADAIRGISNLAAVTGANTEAASRAMYNFSQALAIGKMELRDWRTMENTGMGNKEFREQLILTAKELGYFDREWVDGQNHVISGSQLMNEAYSSFRETLKYGWMDNELMLATLKKYGDETTDIGRKAQEAAQEITTFSKLIDVTLESFQSQWAYVWEAIIGDYNEAKAMWTAVGKEITEIVDNMFSSIRTTLAEWSELGGRFALMATFKNAWLNIKEVIEAVSQGIRNVFQPLTGSALYDMTMKLLLFVKHLKLTDQSLQNITKIVEVLSKVVKIVATVVGKIFTALKPASKILNAVLGTLLDLAGVLADMILELLESVDANAAFTAVWEGLKSVLEIVGPIITSVIKGVADFIVQAKDLPIVQTFLDNIKGSITDLGNRAVPILTTVGDKFTDLFDKIIKFGNGDYLQNGIAFLDEKLTGLYYTMNSGKGVISSFLKLFDTTSGSLGDRVYALGESFLFFNRNVDSTLHPGGALPALTALDKGLEKTGDVTVSLWENVKKLAGTVVKSGLLAAVTTGLASFLITTSRAMTAFGNVANKFKTFLTAASAPLKAWATEIKAGAIMKIAAAIIALAGALTVMTMITDSTDLMKSAAALTALVGSLALITFVLGKLAEKDLFGTFQSASKMMLEMSASVLVLAVAISAMDKALGDASLPEIAKKLGAVITLMVTLATVVTVMSKFTGKGFPKAGLSVLAMAFALKKIINALDELAELDLDGINAALPIVLKIMTKLSMIALASSFMSPFAGVGFLGIVAGLLILETGLEKLSDLSVDKLSKINKTLEIMASVVHGLVMLFGLLTIVKLVSKIAFSIVNNINILANFGENLKSGLDVFGNHLKEAVTGAVKSLTWAAKLIAIVGSFIAVAATIYALSKLPEGDIEKGIIRAVEIGGAMALIMATIAGIENVINRNLKDAASLSTKLASVGLILLGMAAVIKVAGDLDQNGQLENALIGVAGCMGIIIAFEFLLNKLGAMDPKLSIGTKTAASIALLLGVISLSLAILSNFDDPNQYMVPAVALTVVVAWLAVLCDSLGTLKTGPAAASAFAMIGIIAALTIAFKTLETVSWLSILPDVAIMAAAVAGMVAAVKLLSKPLIGNGTVAIIGLSGALIMLGAAAKIFSSCNPGALAQSLIAVGLAIAVLTGAAIGLSALLDAGGTFLFYPGLIALAALGGVLLLFAAGAKLTASALDTFSTSAEKLSGIDLKAIADGLLDVGISSIVMGKSGLGMIATAIGYAILAEKLSLLESCITGFADSVQKLSDSMKQLESIKMDVFADNLKAIADNLIALAGRQGDLQKTATVLNDVLSPLTEMTGALDDAEERMYSFSETAASFATNFESAAKAIDNFVTSIANFNDEVDRLGSQMVDQIIDEIEAYSGSTMPECGRKVFDDFAEGFNGAANSEEMASIARDLMCGLVNKTVELYQDYYDSGYDSGYAWILAFRNAVDSHSDSKEMNSIAIDLCGGLVHETARQLGAYQTSGENAAEAWIDKGFIPWSDGKMEDAAKDGASTFCAALANQESTLEAAGASAGAAAGSGFLSSFASFASSAWGKVTGFLGGTNNPISGSLLDPSTWFNKLGSSATNTFNEIANSVVNVTDVTTTMEDAMEEVRAAQEEAAKQAEENAKKVSESAQEAADAATGEADAVTGAGKASAAASQDMEKLQKAQEALYMSTDVLAKEYGKFYDELGITDAPEKAQQALEALGMTVEEFGDMWQGIEDKAKSALDNIFDAPKDRGWMDKDAILYNMRENINQVSQWADTLGNLGEKAGTSLSKELYEKLAEMGPEGYKYVHAFSEMTDDELKQASEMFTESMTLPTAAANRVSAGFLNAGVMSVAGYAQGIRDMGPALEAVDEFADAIGQTFHDSSLEFGSPSAFMHQMGEWTDLGYALGILDAVDSVVSAINVVSNRIVTEFSMLLNRDEFTRIGRAMVTKIATGMTFDQTAISTVTRTIVTGIAKAIELQAQQINQNGRTICQHMVKGFQDEMSNREPDLDKTIDKMMDLLVKSWQKADNEKILQEDFSLWFIETICTALLDEDTSLNTLDETLDELVAHIDEVLREYEETFIEIGKFWVEGMAKGIAENAWLVQEAAANLASEGVVESTRDVIQFASPSKVSYQIGKYWVQGLANGISDWQHLGVTSAERFAKSILSATQKSGVAINREVRKLMKSVDNITSSNLAKTLAKVSKQIQVYDVSDALAKAWVPVEKFMDKAGNQTEKKLKEIYVKVDSTVKNISKRIKEALNFSNNIDLNISDYESGNDVYKVLYKISKYFTDLDKAPTNVTKFIKNLTKAMEPAKDLINSIGEQFYNTTDLTSSFSLELANAEGGLIRLAEEIFNTTEVGKQFADSIEKGEEAEVSFKSRVEALSKALMEYRDNITATIRSQGSLWEAFNTGDRFNATNPITNMLGNITASKNWSEGIAKLAKNGLAMPILKEMVESGLDSYAQVMSLADADPKTLALIHQVYYQYQKEAEEAATKATAALGYAYSKEARQYRKQLLAEINEGDKLFMEMYSGHLEKIDEFLQKFDKDSKEYNTVLEHMRTVTISLQEPLKLVAQRMGELDEVEGETKITSMEVYQALLELGPTFGVVADSADGTASYITKCTEAMTEWIASVREGLTVSNPFEKFEQETAYSTEQLIYNISSQLTALQKFADGLTTMREMGYSAEVIKYIADLGYENGLKYIDGFINASQAEVGGFNDAYRQILTIPDTLANEIASQMIETGTTAGKALIEAANQAFAEQGWVVPPVDPSQIEEAAEEVATTFNETLTNSSNDGGYMLIEGVADGMGDAEPTLIKAAESAAEAVNQTFASSVEKAGVGENVAKSITTGMQTGVSNGMGDLTNSVSKNMEDLASKIQKTLETAFKNAADTAVNNFQTCVNKIIAMINGIPTDVDIKVTADTSSAEKSLSSMETALQNLNTKLSYIQSDLQTISKQLDSANSKATTLSTTVNNIKTKTSKLGTSSTASATSDEASPVNITYTQNITTPKAVSAYEAWKLGNESSVVSDILASAIG